MAFKKTDFPHLDDTEFPIFDNVNVYKYHNNFDYKRWHDDTIIYLCNVRYNSDYKDTVKFENDEKRDAYFDSIKSEKIDLKTRFHVAPDDTVNIPVPYQVANTYNYLYVDLPIATDDNNPLNYESESRVRRYYYFIEYVEQLSPSTTRLHVKLDSWTTFINRVDIPFLMLERGHAPMSAIDVDTYLNCPIDNNRYLLAPDFDFADDNGIVKDSEFVPVGNGKKYIMFSTTMSPQHIKELTFPDEIVKDGFDNTTQATYSDETWNGITVENGHLYHMSDYKWDFGGYDFNYHDTKTTPMLQHEYIIPNGFTVVAVPSENARTFFEYMALHIPFFFKTIKACYMVDENMFTRSEELNFCNTVCYFVKQASDNILKYIKLDKKMFNFDEKYKNITKLYTFPYSRIEATDNYGNVKTFKVENISNLKMMQDITLSYPYLSIQVFLSGISGKGVNEYKWQRMNNQADAKAISADDFSDYLFKWDIPTYALFVRGYDIYRADNYASQWDKRYNAICDYQKTVGSLNAEYANALANAKTAKENAMENADIEFNNSVNYTEAVYNNSVASNETTKLNIGDSNYTNNDIVWNSTRAEYNNMILANTNRSVMTNISNSAASTLAKNENEYIEQSNTSDNWASAINNNAENDAVNQQGHVNAAMAFVGGASSMLGNLGTGSKDNQGNVLGAGGSLIYGITGAYAAACTSTITIAKNDAIVATEIQANSNQGSIAKAKNLCSTSISNNANAKGTINTNNTQFAVTNNNLKATRYAADQSAIRSIANAQRSCKTGNANAKKLRDTSIVNAVRTRQLVTNFYDSDIKNYGDIGVKNYIEPFIGTAENNYITAVNNATRIRDRNIYNAKILAEQKRIDNQQNYLTHRLDAPVKFGDYSGDANLDALERRGIQIKIRTEKNGDIAQVGDLMLRYGYSLNQVWNIEASGFNLMKHFTYWKASDIWINEGDGVNQNAQDDIKNILLNGVTVWHNPEEIGKVSIYVN